MVLCSVWIDGILCKVTKHLLNNKILTHKIYFINISYPPFCSLHGIRCKLYAKSHTVSVVFWLVVLLCFNVQSKCPKIWLYIAFFLGQYFLMRRKSICTLFIFYRNLVCFLCGLHWLLSFLVLSILPSWQLILFCVPTRLCKYRC